MFVCLCVLCVSRAPGTSCMYPDTRVLMQIVLSLFHPSALKTAAVVVCASVPFLFILFSLHVCCFFFFFVLCVCVFFCLSFSFFIRDGETFSVRSRYSIHPYVYIYMVSRVSCCLCLIDPSFLFVQAPTRICHHSLPSICTHPKHFIFPPASYLAPCFVCSFSPAGG